MAPTVSVVVPVFQNEANLPDTVPKLLGLRELLPGYRLELVFVDDGSTDRSLEILSAWAEQQPGVVKVVKLTRNFGQTPAIQAGLRHAAGDGVAVISADLQEPWEAIADMVKAWERGARFVIGERHARAESRRHRRASGLYWTIVRRFAFPDFPSLGYDFCLLDRQIVEDVNGINEKNSSIFVLIYWLGYRPTRVPITRALRDKGRSQWRLGRKVRFTLDTLIAFTTVPARLITVMSFSLVLLCLLVLAVNVGFWLWLKATPPGWMTEVALITLVGAMILFALGIVSEYLQRILDEARKRPPFVVERVIAPREDRGDPGGGGGSGRA